MFFLMLAVVLFWGVAPEHIWAVWAALVFTGIEASCELVLWGIYNAPKQ